jgi:hypothetical protein
VNEACSGVLVGAPVHEEDPPAEGCSKTTATSDADEWTIGDERPCYADESARAGEASSFLVCGSDEINGDHRTPRR